MTTPLKHLVKGNFRAFINTIGMEGLTILLGTILIFLLINFNKELGIIFTFMLVLDWIIAHTIPTHFNFEKDTNRTLDFLYAIGAYIVFILISSVVAAVIIGGTALANPLNSVFDSLAATVPIFEQSKVLTFVGWGIIIPLVETSFFFGRLLEMLAHTFSINLTRPDVFKQPKTWILFAAISSMFMFFHLSAKAITTTTFDTTGLALTFLFGMFSCFLVVYRKEISTAAYLHVISNSLAISIKLGYKFLGAILGI